MKTYKLLAASAIVIATLSACSDSNPVSVSDSSVTASSNDDTNIDNRNLSNIVQTASTADTFNTLASLLVSTGLDAVLSDEGRKFTVFAPTDAAFEKLDADTLSALSADSEALSNVLLYHVLADKEVNATSAIGLAGGTTDTANGDAIALSLNDGKLFINMSEVTVTDVAASNGIIHAIDTVLIPPASDETGVMLSNIVDTAVNAGTFSTLVTALQATGLDTTLADESATFTVFAPTDEAFAKLGTDTITALLADTATLSDILLYHVISGSAVDATTAMSLAGNSTATSNGDDIALSIRDNKLFINDSEVIATDIQTSNGIIHVIDTVLLPPADDASDSNDNTTSDNNDGASNESENASDTIFGVAESAGFSTLIAAVKVAGLEGALDHPGDIYTVFAPTNEAFAALGQATIDQLLADPERLRSILLLHVLPGTAVDAATATSLIGVDIETGSGNIVQISQQDKDLFIQDAKIINADIAAVNGVIHVIDKVLLP